MRNKCTENGLATISDSSRCPYMFIICTSMNLLYNQIKVINTKYVHWLHCINSKNTLNPVNFQHLGVWSLLWDMKYLKWFRVCFIYILDSSNSSSFTFWSIKLAFSSRSNWTNIWTSNSKAVELINIYPVSVQQKRRV